MDTAWCWFTLENVVLTPGWDSYGGRHSSLLVSFPHLRALFCVLFLSFHYFTHGLYQICMGYYKDQFSHSLLGISRYVN